MENVFVKSGYIVNKSDKVINVTLLCDRTEVMITHIPPKSARKIPMESNNVQISSIEQSNTSKDQYTPYSIQNAAINPTYQYSKINNVQIKLQIDSKSIQTQGYFHMLDTSMIGFFEYDDLGNLIWIELSSINKTSKAKVYDENGYIHEFTGTIDQDLTTSKIILHSTAENSNITLEIFIDHTKDQPDTENSKLSGEYSGITLDLAGSFKHSSQFHVYDNHVFRSHGHNAKIYCEAFGYINPESNIFMMVTPSYHPPIIAVASFVKDTDNQMLEGFAWTESKRNFTLVRVDNDDILE